MLLKSSGLRLQLFSLKGWDNIALGYVIPAFQAEEYGSHASPLVMKASTKRFSRVSSRDESLHEPIFLSTRYLKLRADKRYDLSK